MSNGKNQGKLRLPRNFHKTFIPERQYINAMLLFAASGKQGTYQEIAKDTGIPMGRSTGKVPAIIDYCRGMGLIKEKPKKHSSVKKPELTDLGRIVYLEDPFLKERVTQWLAHLILCSPIMGADVWYQVFVKGAHHLGNSFSRTQLHEFLSSVYEVNTPRLIGPLIRMYKDEAAFSKCGVLIESRKVIKRKIAPILDEFAFAYGVWLLKIIADFFPKSSQITLKDLDSYGGFMKIPCWDSEKTKEVLIMIERKDLVEIDRHMNPWIIEPKTNYRNACKRIYVDLI